MDIQKTKNTLNIDYEYDKLNNVGQFALTYRKDNKTVKIDENDSVSIYYFKEGKGDLHLVSIPKIVGGQVKFDQAAMGDSLSSGTYDIYSTVNGEIYPSQGYVKIKLETHVENGVQITVLTGPQGEKGEKGDVGPAGPAGPKGDQGPVGPAGKDGSQGPVGPAGPKGDQGPVGPAGPKGDQGPVGPAGKDGPQGPVGPTGPKGDQGPAGPAGPKGDQGPAGPAGKDGSQGPVGPAGKDGPQGPVGPAGEKGEIGPQGPIGLTGPAGPKGDQGPAGEKGSDGLSAYQLSVKQGFVGDEKAWLASLKGEVGPKGDQGPQGEKGPQGPQGDVGPQGPAGQPGKDGGGSKLKSVYYDPMLRKKAIFENDDGSSIESNIFSDPNLPENPKNLTSVSLLKSDQAQALKPQVLNAGLSDVTIHVPFTLHTQSPTSSGNSYNSLDVHLDTSNLIDRKTGVTFKIVDTVDEFVKHQWFAKEASVSPDRKTVAVKILPVINGSTIYIPKFDHHWHEYPDRVFMTTDFYNQVPNLVGTDDDFSSGLHSMGSSNTYAFSRVDKISILWFSRLDRYDIIMLLYSSDKPQVWAVDSGTIFNLKNGEVTPINYTFTGFTGYRN